MFRFLWSALTVLRNYAYRFHGKRISTYKLKSKVLSWFLAKENVLVPRYRTCTYKRKSLIKIFQYQVVTHGHMPISNYLTHWCPTYATKLAPGTNISISKALSANSSIAKMGIFSRFWQFDMHGKMPQIGRRGREILINPDYAVLLINFLRH